MISKLISNNIYNKIPCIKLDFDKELKELYYNYQEYILLIDEKNKINDYSKEWEKYKKMSNDYELIYLANKNLKNESISAYEPLSRSYFKMWEMLHNFDFIQGKDKINYAALAEGPGGFIEAINNYTKAKGIETNIYGITLMSTDKDIPGWKKAEDYILKNNNNIKISYGKDGTGNLYKLENIIFFSKFIGGKMDIVSGDAGFDFSNDFNNQEVQSSRIIFCEIVTALAIQKKGGIFVCKLFDSYTNITIQFINLLCHYYKNVYFVKPLTSRPANSEKYIICKDFNGIDERTLNKLFILVRNWELIEKGNYHINRILDSIIDIDLLNKIIEFNTIMCNLQISNIKQTLDIIKNKNRLETLSNIIKEQTTNAIVWCKKYNIEINKKSNFLT